MNPRPSADHASDKLASQQHDLTKLLPTKVSESTVYEGSNDVVSEAYPCGQPSRWTAQPVLQWIESLAAATEQADDQRGPLTVGGVRLAEPSSTPNVLVQQLRECLKPRIDDIPIYGSGPVGWDLSYIDQQDPLAWTYTRQIKSLASCLENLIKTAKNVSTVPTDEAVSLLAAYHLLQTRVEFTFGRILGQEYDSSPSHQDCLASKDSMIDPPVSSIEGGELRQLLDTLYEETIQHLQTAIADYQNGSTGVSATKHLNKMMSGKPLPKQEIGKYMTEWLRNNWTNPYPDDDGVATMAAHCGTTNKVISNWLINARTRKWRPSIEKAIAMNRPADLLLEDSINIFDNLAVRHINDSDYRKQPQPQPQLRLYQPQQWNAPQPPRQQRHKTYHDDSEWMEDDSDCITDYDDSDQQSIKRFKVGY